MEWVLEIEIRSYFDSIVRSALVGMIEKRGIDGSVLRLIGKWIKVGVIEEGRLLVSETGTGQGQPISPLLANIYLHYALDEWFESEVKPRLKGEAYEIRRQVRRRRAIGRARVSSAGALAIGGFGRSRGRLRRTRRST